MKKHTKNAKRTGHFLWLFLTCFVAATTAHATPQRSKRAKSAASSDVMTRIFRTLPKNTRVLLALDNLPQLTKELDSTPLFKMLAEPEVAPLAKAFNRILLGKPQSRWGREPMFKKLQRIFLTLTGTSLGDAMNNFQGPYAFAFAKPLNIAEPMGVAAVLHFKDGAKAEALLQAILKHVPLTRKRYKHNGATVESVKGFDNEFHFAKRNDHYLMSSSASLMKQMLDLETGRSKVSLASDPHFQSFLQKTGKTPGLRFYLSAQSLFNDLYPKSKDPYAPRGARRALDTLGLTSWHGIGAHISVRQKRFETQLYVKAPLKDGEGLEQLFTLPPVDTSLLSKVPRSSKACVLIRIPWTRYWDKAMAVLKKQSPRQYRKLNEQRKRIEKAFLQFPVRDLLDALGESAAGFTFPYHGGGLIPQWGIVMKLKNPKRVKRAFLLLTGMMGPGNQSKQRSYRGIQYTSVFMGYRTRRLFPVPLRLLFANKLHLAFDGDYLFFSPIKQSLMTIIDRHKEAAGNAKTQAQKTSAQHQGAGIIAAWNLKTHLLPVYNTLLAVKGYVGQHSPILRMLGLGQLMNRDWPRASVLAKYFHTDTMTLHQGKQDLHVKMRTSMGLELMLLGNIGAQIVQHTYFRHPITRYLDDVERTQKLNAKHKAWQSNKLYYKGYQAWLALKRSAVLESVTKIAEKEAAAYRKQYKQQKQATLKALRQAYSPKQDWSWTQHGDWSFDKGVLTGRGTASETRLLFGEGDWQEYVLEFDARFLPKKHKKHDSRIRRRPMPVRPQSLFVGIHAQSNRADVTYNTMSKKAFYSYRFRPKTWTPIRIKVKGKRASYWFRYKRHSFRTYRKSGYIALILPRGSHIQIRNLRVKRPKTVQSSTGTPYPRVGISFLTNGAVVNKGGSVQYTLLLRNTGSRAATAPRLRFQVSAHLGRPYLRGMLGYGQQWDPRSKTLTLTGLPALAAKQSLRIRIQAKAQKVGSASLQALFGFAQLKGELFTEARSHVIAPLR